jgi:hypothetical protein
MSRILNSITLNRFILSRGPLRIRGRFDGRSAAAIHTEEQNPLRWDKTRFYAIVCAAAFIARSDR